MGTQSINNPRRHRLCRLLLPVLFFLCRPASPQSLTSLHLPSGLAYDAQGNLFFAESSGHVVRQLSAAGALTVFAGTGAQGFAGDGGAATAALLDTPGALALDAAGNLYIADTHNHRIREVTALTGVISTFAGTGTAGSGRDGLSAAATAIDLPSALAFAPDGSLCYADLRNQIVRRIDAVSHTVTTIAGTGTQGFSGDGGVAVRAMLDSPAGLAFDAAGDLYISDAHNQRIRRVDHATQLITTFAGTGTAGYSSGAASAASLSLPRGLAVDPSGTLFIVDAGNHRVRRVDPASGQITSVAGTGTEGFAGDEAPATQASLDSPRGLALSPAGLPTLADTENLRVRQVDSAGIIHTIAGGATAAVSAGLALSGPATTVYGAGTLSAKLGGATATGVVNLFDGTVLVATSALISNAASFSLASLHAGAHSLSATFAGDSGHASSVSSALALTVTPAPLQATPNSANTVYGLPIPALTGALTGVLPQDAAAVQVSFSSAAVLFSPAGSYPIAAAVSGAAADNYLLSTGPAQLTIAKAGTSATLSGTLLAQVSAATSGQPGGSLSLLDGGVPYTTLPLASGSPVQFSSAGLSNGSHTLSASYSGDGNFLPSVSAPVVLSIGTATAPDFTLAAVQSSVTVPAGSSAVFNFTETPANGALSSPILLSASGLPLGATAVFSPAYLPPNAAPIAFTLTIQTIKTASLRVVGGVVFACTLGFFCFPRRARRYLVSCALLGSLAGCGDRVSAADQSAATSRAYNITVNATATSSAGTTLLHSANVVLTLD